LNEHQHWATDLQGLLAQQTCVLVSLKQIMGSAPRESGCRMIVTADVVRGSIGGGNLEFTAIARARDLLRQADTPHQFLEPFGLGPALNQCCGGAVSLLFERLPPGAAAWLDELVSAQAANMPAVLAAATDLSSPLHYVITRSSARPADLPEAVWQAAFDLLARSNLPNGSDSWLEMEQEAKHWWLELIQEQRPELFLFGAGHVGQEVARRIRGLPFRLNWLDQRPDIFPEDASKFATLIATDPLAAVATARTGSIFVVMSHSHQLDEDICHAILARNDPEWDFAWLGLIGSATKRKRFVHRLQQRGISELQLQRLVCPIGLAGIRGKQPATIAHSLLAQLMMETTWTAANN
jgi:xanthine dehydrogenase accessory factor